MQYTHFGLGCRIIVFLNRCAEQQQVTIVGAYCPQPEVSCTA